MSEEMDVGIRRARYSQSRSELIKEVREVEEDGRWNGTIGGTLWIRLHDGYVVYTLNSSKILLYIKDGIFELNVEKSAIEVFGVLSQVSTVQELIQKLSPQ